MSPRGRCSRHTILLFALLTAAATDSVYAEWRFDGTTGFVYDSNLSNSDRSADVQDDWSWKTDLRVGNGFQLLRDLRLNVAADLHGQLWDNFGAFNEIGGGAIIGARYRFGLGRTAPWLLLENRIGYDRFQESDQSGYNETIALRGGASLTERIAVEAGYLFDNFAAPNNFYDQQSHRIESRAVFDVISGLQVAVGYFYREGDVIAYAVPPRPDIVSLAVEREEVTNFGSNPLYTAYKFLGRTHGVSISAGYAVTKNISVQVEYEYSSTSHDPIRYHNHLVEAKVAFAY